jgi:hypothetical protein
MLLANAGSKNEVSKAALRTFHCSLQNRQETSIRCLMTWGKSACRKVVQGRP